MKQETLWTKGDLMYKIAELKENHSCGKITVQQGWGQKLCWTFPFCYHEWGTVLDLPIVQLAHILFEAGTGQVFSA